MRRDLIIAFLLVAAAHVGVAMIGPGHPKHLKVDDEGPVIIIPLPPPPPPEPPDTTDEQVPADLPTMAPPTLADVPTNVPVNAFTTPVEPPPPPGVQMGTAKIDAPIVKIDQNNLGRIFNPNELDQVAVPTYAAQPDYPFALKQQGIQGTVVVEFVCDATGHVVNPVIISSTNHDFDQAVLQAVVKWRFKPGRLHGRAVNQRIQQPFVFNLDDN